MKGWHLAFQDMRQLWSSRVLRISVIALMVLPLLYSFLYLWAFWNPASKLNRLPLAVANEDTGIDSQGRRQQFGRMLQDRLTSDNETHWSTYPADESRRKLATGEVAGALLIPRDFSEAATSAGTDRPRHPELTLELSQGRNMLGASYVRAITAEVKRQLNAQLSVRYLHTLFDQVLNGGQGLSQASAAASKLASGTDQAYKGAQSLAAGLNDVQTGIERLGAGLIALQNGSGAMQNELRKLDRLVSSSTAGGGAAAVDWGQTADSLRQSASEAAAARRRLAAAASTLHGQNSEASAAMDAARHAGSAMETARAQAAPLRVAAAAEKTRFAEADEALAHFLQAHPDVKPEESAALQQAMRRLGHAVAVSSQRSDAMAGAAEDAAGSMAGSLDRLAASQQATARAAADVSSEAAALAAIEGKVLEQASRQAVPLAQLSEHVRELSGGVRNLSDGTGKLTGGLLSLTAGITSAREGMNRLAGGAAELAPALMTIRDGQHELAGKLSEAAALSSRDEHAEERIAVIADPLQVSEINHHPVPNNGTGFAPYFIALSLWFGSIVLFFVVDVTAVHASSPHPISYFVSKYLALASVSLAQAVISVFVLHTALGLNTKLPAIQLYSLAIVTGLSFSAILFLLISALGSDKGRFVSVIILMLQLTSSGGSYPVEMTPEPIRFLNPYLPMTYAVEGFRQVISVGDPAALGRDMLILAGFGIGSLLLLYLLKRKSIAQGIREARAGRLTTV